MITISACMIVKNEEKVLRRCLDSIKDLMDEIIIVDTGSTDSTKEIAAEYTDKIFDYEWIDDFADARNFSFSKATCDYIYAPDADELLDEENRKQFLFLKECMDERVEIVQMRYNTVAFDTVLNVREEYRPKLFKRIRHFIWEDPVHETIRTTPIVFESDVVITHQPESSHSGRDFKVFETALLRGTHLSDKAIMMYATELYKCGTLHELSFAAKHMNRIYESGNEYLKQATLCVLVRFTRLSGDTEGFIKLALRDMVSNPCSEVCCEIGQYFFDNGDYDEAILWFENASENATPCVDIHSAGDTPLTMLSNCYDQLAFVFRGEEEGKLYQGMAEKYKAASLRWTMPVEEIY